MNGDGGGSDGDSPRRRRRTEQAQIRGLAGVARSWSPIANWTTSTYVLVASVAVIVIAVGWALVAAYHWLAPAGEPVLVPEFVGRDLADAQASAANLGIGLHVIARRPDYHHAKDRILGQLPVAGQHVRQGRNIDVIVSDGLPIVRVPNLSNMNIRDARLTLENNRLVLGKTAEMKNEDAIAGTVLGQKPEPFQPVSAGTKVDIVVAKGRPAIYTPNFVGLSESFAKAAAKELSIPLNSPIPLPMMVGAKPKGVVEEQDPAAGQLLLPKQRLTLRVSGGAPPTPTPSPSAAPSLPPGVSLPPSGAQISPTPGLPSPAGRRALRVSVSLPFSATPKRVRVVLQDASGAKTLYDQKTSGGFALSFDVNVVGSGTIETYVGDTLANTTPL